MSVKNFLMVVETIICDKKDDIGLLSYYIFPALNNAGKSEKDKELIESFKQNLI